MTMRGVTGCEWEGVVCAGGVCVAGGVHPTQVHVVINRPLDRQTLVKILPSRIYVGVGKKLHEIPGW